MTNLDCRSPFDIAQGDVLLSILRKWKSRSMGMPKNKKAFGDWGEDIAVNFLEKKGFTILQRNFRAERGEIDIIARRETALFLWR